MDRLRKLESRIVVGREGKALADRLTQVKQELLAVRSDRDSLRERVDEQEAKLDDAASEIRRLVAALQVRAEQVLGKHTDITDFPPPSHGSGKGSGTGSGIEGAADSTGAGGDRTAALVADLASLPTAQARRAGLLFEVGRARDAEQRMAARAAGKEGETTVASEQASKQPHSQARLDLWVDAHARWSPRSIPSCSLTTKPPYVSHAVTSSPPLSSLLPFHHTRRRAP